MGKGRAPCCDKSKVKRGPWSPSEDLKLITFIQKNGHENWRSLPKQAGLLRCGKSCRLRWINYLRPDLKRGNFTAEEEDTIILLHQSLGNKWSKIASCLPGRTDNEIKNVWHTHLKKRLAQKPGTDHQELLPNEFSSSSMSSDDSDVLNPEEKNQTGSSSGFTETKDGNIDTFGEVDNPDLLEIPFDSDTDIWSLLDGLDSSQQSKIAEISPENPEAEDEIQKWFRYLENELGLEEDENQQHLSKTQEGKKSLFSNGHEKLAKREDDPVTGYFNSLPLQGSSSAKWSNLVQK